MHFSTAVGFWKRKHGLLAALFFRRQFHPSQSPTIHPGRSFTCRIFSSCLCFWNVWMWYVEILIISLTCIWLAMINMNHCTYSNICYHICTRCRRSKTWRFLNPICLSVFEWYLDTWYMPLSEDHGARPTSASQSAVQSRQIPEAIVWKTGALQIIMEHTRAWRQPLQPFVLA